MKLQFEAGLRGSISTRAQPIRRGRGGFGAIVRRDLPQLSRFQLGNDRFTGSGGSSIDFF